MQPTRAINGKAISSVGVNGLAAWPSSRTANLANLLLLAGSFALCGLLAIVDGNLREFSAMDQIVLILSVLVWLMAWLLGLVHLAWSVTRTTVGGWLRKSPAAPGLLLWDDSMDGLVERARPGPHA